ncbi:hypothetical protein SYNPS1DRAFT_28585 [Syncephalis pseudoplumigaleata]|uniref:Uncharacterized protein n=1 Tax=Syncephalis pseudoplumigaleata TaxID=1712513 RepID=A0A4P9Z0B5_9FUNG|nr:hypothetical protein SYNPS1DRAFT_28585 [Syncephalis pseudoplumigaleata]|eukprot:RKP25685.1 hypothetical protein SYNPS1DRAFT_28585 [Syncephalis pseudoplumigaleata]
MPIIDYSNPDKVAWTKNATTLWDIPLHPLGEINYLDYFVGLAGGMKEQRAKLFAIEQASIMLTAMVYLFAYNFVISSKMVMMRPLALSSWCCLLPSVAGLIAGIMSALVTLGLLFNCRIVIWTIGFGTGIALVCNSTILLQKSYIVLNRKRWILYVSVPLIVLQFSYPFAVMFYTYATIDAHLGCMLNFPYGFIWYWAIINAPLSTFFSVVFCRVCFKQYRQYGSDTWRQLAQDGIQTVVLALLCNIFYGVLIVLQPPGLNTDHFFIMDCHCQSMRNKQRQTSSYIRKTLGSALKKAKTIFKRA